MIQLLSEECTMIRFVACEQLGQEKEVIQAGVVSDVRTLR